MPQQQRPVLVLAFHALDLGAADGVGERSRLGAQEQALAAVDLQRVDVLAASELEPPDVLRRRPLGEAARAGLVRLFVAGLVQTRQRAVGRTRQEVAVADEGRRVVQRLQRPVGRQAALVRATLLQL